MYFALRVDDDLELQLLEEDHAEGLFRVVDDCREHIDAWLPWARSHTRVDQTKKFIQRAKSNWGAGRGIQTAIVWRGELCGVVSIKFDDHAGDVSYWLHPDYEGRGIVTRSTRSLVDYAFAHYQMRRCTIRAAPENEKSWAIPERLGFTHEGTLREAGSHPDGNFDLKLYALLRREWERGWDALQS